MEPLTFIPGTEPLYYDRDYNFFVLAGGRGSGKSWSVARALLTRACNEKLRIMCVRENQNSIAESVHKLLETQIDNLGLRPYFDVQRDGIYGANGTEVFYRGIRNDPGKVKSTEGVDICWLEEGENITEESWDILEPTIRKAGSQVFVVYNPRYEEDYLYNLFSIPTNRPPKTFYLELSYKDNPFFSERNREQMEHMRVSNPLRYEHVWEGKCVPNLSTALWPWESISNHRLPVGSAMEFGRVVVTIDPAVTANKKSDETGIIVAASSKAAPRHYYVLADVSGRFLPETWARRALDAYDTFEADAIVYETNQGGEMVADTLRNVCRTDNRPVPRLIAVRATRGKAVRAEPVAALYTQGVVHHVGNFPDLERQLVRFDPLNPNQKSPDRLDALVWAMTELSQSRAPMRIAKDAAQRFFGTNFVAAR